MHQTHLQTLYVICHHSQTSCSASYTTQPWTTTHTVLFNSSVSGVLLKNRGGYTYATNETSVYASIHCFIITTEVSIRCQKNTGGWYTVYTHVYPQYTPVIKSFCHSSINRYWLETAIFNHLFIKSNSSAMGRLVMVKFHMINITNRWLFMI